MSDAHALSGLDPAVCEGCFAENSDPCFVYAVGTPPAPRFTIAAVNPAWLEVTGLPRETVGKGLEQLMPPEVASMIGQRLERAVQERAPIVFEEELRFKDQIRYWRTTIAPLVVDDAVR